MHPWHDESLAANGKQVRENFTDWFKAGIAGQDGEPLVLYHGTWYDFDRFEQTEDIGFHFGTVATANKRIALWLDDDGSIEDANIMPVYLAVQNPLRLPDLHTWDSRDVAAALRDAGLFVTAEDFEQAAAYNDRNTIRALLAAHGFDGIVYDNATEGGGDSYIVFDPSKIKSALGNAGLYLEASPSMTDAHAALALERASDALKSTQATRPLRVEA